MLAKNNELILPKTLRNTLCKTNLLQLEEEEFPKNCLVMFDDDSSSVQKFILGFISFKQPNFERTQIFCRDFEQYFCALPLFIENRPGVSTFTAMQHLTETDFDAILRSDDL